MTAAIAIALLAASGYVLGRRLMSDFRARVTDYEEEYLAEAAEKLDALYSFVPPDQVLAISMWSALGAGALGVVLFLRVTLVGAIFIGCLLALAGAVVPRLTIRYLVYQREKALLRQLADAITMMANCIKSGLGMQQALDQVAKEMPPPISQEFRIMIQDRQTGRNFEESLERFASRVPLAEVKMFALVLRLAQRVGGNVGTALTRVGETIRNRGIVEEKVMTLTSQSRMQAVILALMPFLMALIELVLSPDLARPFYFSKIGAVAFSLVLVLEGLAAYTIWRILRIKY